MKKFIAFVFTALAVVSIAFGEYETVDGIEYNYTISNGKASIVGEVFIWEEWFEDPEGGGGSSIMSEEYYPSIAGSTSGSLIVPSTLGDCPVTSIGYIAFWGCRYLTSVTIPEGVTTIGYEAFDGCSSLTSVKIPEGVTTIGSYAFYDCSSLVSITIPDSVTEIGSSAFSNCRSLKTIYVDRGDENRVRELLQGKGVNVCDLTFVQGSLPNGGPYKEIVDGVEFTFSILNGEVVIEAEDCSAAISTSTSGALVIPSTLGGCPVTTIGSSAFSSCSLLTSVTIPEGVTSIGSYAFYDCSSLTSVTIPEGVTTIGGDAFSGCSSLSSVTIPSSVTTIGYEAFYGCRSLTSVTIPESVMTIGGRAFSGCSSLTSVTIPDSVTTIGYRAFDGTPFVDNQPDGLVILGRVLYECKGTCPSEVTIPESVTTIGESVFYRCSKLTSVTIPSSVSTIGDRAFAYCNSLTSVTISEGVTAIGNYAFSDCSSLTSVTIPESVTTIGSSAFAFCSSLTSVTIPEGVTTIGSSAFESCRSLESVTIPESVTTIGYRAFDGTPFVDNQPDGLVILGRVLYECKGTCPSEVTIPESVTTIGRYAFSSCSSLTAVTIPLSVTTIEVMAFSGCSSLTSVTIPNSVTTIGDWAFSGCSSLRTVYVDYGDTDRVKELMRGKGVDVDTLTFVEAAYKLVIDENGCVTGFDGELPSELVIPNGVKVIGQKAFKDCTTITSIKLPSSVTSVGKRAFYGCENLETVILPTDKPNIGSQAFFGVPWYENAVVDYASGASQTVANSVTVTNVVVHYVLNSVQPEFAKPVSEDTGFVNVIAEVKGMSVAVPQTWAENYPEFAAKFGSDFTKALTMKNGKIAVGGREMLVWEDYVAGTDPTNPNDKFTATMTMVDGKPVISWTPELDAERAAMRKYTTYGKVKLTDGEWREVAAGEEGDYNFFKVTVEMR